MFAGIPLPPLGNLNLTCMIIFMINSSMRLREVVSIETPDAKQTFANNVRNKEMFLQKLINPGHKTESEEFDPTDNPTDEYMAQQQKAADDIVSMKQMNKPFGYADKYLSNKEAHKKPYHFINPATGKTSGEGPYYGIVFSKLPQNDREWMALGFTKAVNGAWFINNQYLKKLVDKNVIS